MREAGTGAGDRAKERAIGPRRPPSHNTSQVWTPQAPRPPGSPTSSVGHLGSNYMIALTASSVGWDITKVFHGPDNIVIRCINGTGSRSVD